MSKILGIIAEYNPFHNGHKYHIQKAKELTGANYVIAIISGNFTQRGETSVIDKWSKAKTALLNDVDLVIELPVIYSVSSAENFANGAIKILNSLGVVDYISFGAETTDIKALDTISNILSKEPKGYKQLLSLELSKGVCFPKARQLAICNYLTYSLKSDDIKTYRNILDKPNNILAIEYLKALKKSKSKIEPILVERFNSAYNDTNYTGNIASATAIRNILSQETYDIKVLNSLLPQKTFDIVLENIKSGHIVPNLSYFEKEILYLIRKMSPDEIKNYPDVSEGLEFSIKNAANSSSTIFDFLNIIKSKRYTITRLQRILVYILLRNN